MVHRLTMSQPTDLLPSVTAWLESTPSIKFAVLFGSSARNLEASRATDRWSDLDLHIVTSDPCGVENVNWATALPGKVFCLKVVRPATGGVRKLTVLFNNGQLDLVLIPARQLYLAKLGM